MAEDFTLIAHRGLSSEYPENTIAAFDAGLLHGFPHIELDVQLSRDGVALVLHDGDPKRVAQPACCTSIGFLTADEASQIDVGMWKAPRFAGERIPWLKDVLQRYASDDVHLHLELKSLQPDLPDVVATNLSACGWMTDMGARGGSSSDTEPFGVPGLTLTSFHLGQLQASRKMLPKVRHGWLVQELNDDNIATAAACGLQGLYPRADIITKGVVTQALEAGLSVRAWGVRTLELMHKVRSCGAQGCTVDWPDRAKRSLQHKPGLSD